ncbi:MAG: ammonium transporter [Verrucomicrobia bacterium]|nr:ammonium transporter [Verrucomicrobiota bacterium]
MTKLLRRFLIPGCLAALPLATFAAEAEPWTPPPIDTGTTAWMLVSTALVLMMIPALAMFYGGLTRTKNVLGTMMHSFAAMAVVGVVWTVCGYAMCFGASHGWCGWDPKALFLHGIDSGPDAYYLIDVNGVSMAIPTLVFAMFQGKFAMITPALIAGSFAERVKFSSYCLFIALWSLLVYNPLAHWVWGGGFMTGKAIDFAGGTVIHISAGVAGLVVALYLGRRRGYPETAMQPSNLVMTLTGAGLLWVGWFGFNAGSSVASGLQTAQALTVTQVAAASGALAWLAIEGLRHGKATSLGLASGILAGLVAITPAAGDVQPYGAMILGVVASIACYGAIALKNKLGYDDTLDVLGIHGTAGVIGAVGLAFLLRPSPDRLPLTEQLMYQLEGVGVSIIYAAVATFLIVLVVDKLIGFRLSPDHERAGMDYSLHGEHGYGIVNVD